MVHGALGTVAVEHLQPEIARGQVALHRGQSRRRLPRQNTDRRLVAVDAGANEIGGPEISHIDHQSRDQGRDLDKGGRSGCRSGSRWILGVHARSWKEDESRDGEPQ